MADDETLRWGNMGAGLISHDFCLALAATPNNAIVCVGARSQASAAAFAAEHGTADTRAYGSYEEVAADPCVDIVYVRRRSCCPCCQV